MPSDLKPFGDYVSALQKNLATGKATEPSHYPARAKYDLGDDVRDWKVSLAQKDLERSGLRQELVVTASFPDGP